MNFPVPLDEEDRLRVLQSYGILDTPADKSFDTISAFAKRLFDVPIVLVSLIDRDRQFLKSCFGIDARETPREIAFCSHTILTPKEPLIVEDASKDARFANNRLVTGEPYIRFYAGVPLLPQHGSALGSFCIIDRKPRSLTPAELQNLQDLASMVEDTIKLHERRKVARESEERYRTLHSAVSDSLEHLRENLIWMIPHELSTPLNGVLGFADLLKDSWRDIQPEQAQELISGLHDAGMRMEHGVRNICLLSQLEIASSDPLALNKLRDTAPQPIDEIAETIAKEKAQEAERSDDLELQLEPGRVGVPKPYLSKMLHELLDNAFKFSEPGASVKARGEASDDGYELSIFNEGRGMTLEQIDRIDAFMQFERDTFEQQGLGLGLALVRRIARVYEVFFGVSSKPGEGLRVNLRFPSPELKVLE